MAINLAEKWSSRVDERFTRGALTTPGVNNDYDFTGAKTVFVYNIPTAEMNDYARSGQNRYGIPEELQDTAQALTVTRDRSFSLTIDLGVNGKLILYKKGE